MADFYEEMLAMVDDLLAPTSADGLGQGTIELVHVKNVSDPSQPWLPPVESVTSEVIRGAARGVSKNLVGTSIGDTLPRYQRSHTKPATGFASMACL